MSAVASGQRQLLFDAGAAAFARVLPDVFDEFPDIIGWYVCPLCLQAFPPEALVSNPPWLTVDEAPPAASTRGPVAKVLTCKTCNNEAGWRLESHLANRRRIEDFLAGRLTQPLRVDLEAGDGTRIRADATFHNGNLSATGVRASTHPDDFASHWSWWNTKVGQVTWQFKVHMTPYDHRRSQVALIKAAYLAGFAAFGYTYVWRQQLDPVRAEVRDPAGGHLSRFPILTDHDQEPSVHRVLLAADPLRGLCLQIGQDFILLPWLDSPPSFWEDLDDSVRRGVRTITFDAVGDWPRFAEYRLDNT